MATTLIFILISLKMVSGSFTFEISKFCIFAGDFEISKLINSIKIRSEKMMFSVVVNFEELSNFLPTVRTGATIVTSGKIETLNFDIAKRSDLLWLTMSDLKNTSLKAWNFSSFNLPPSSLRYKNSFCKPSISIGVISEEKICDSILSNESLGTISCYQFQLMEMLGRRFNFTRRIIELDDKRYPYVFPNGSHSGLFRIIADLKADVSCGSFVVTRKRLEKYKFLWPTFSLESKIYLKREEKHDSWSNFSKPFEKDVWAAIFIYLGISALVRHLLYRSSFTLRKNQVSLYQSFLLSLQIFCNQGLQDIPSHFSIRLVHLLGLLAAMVLYPLFSGSVVSFLTVKVPFLPFLDFEGLIENHEYRLLTSEESFLTSYFYFESKIEFEEKRKNLLVGLNNLAKNAKEGLKRICNEENLVYADSELTLNSLLMQLECKVVEVPNPILVRYAGMIVDENLPCRDRLVSGLLHLRSIGIIERMQSNLIPAHLAFSNQVHRSIENDLRPISMTDIYPCLVLHFLGFSAAIMMLFLERFIQKRCRTYSIKPVIYIKSQ